MKKILGSLILFVSFLHASYSWTTQIEKEKYYQNEAFLVTFTCQFDDRSSDMFIEFNPQAEYFSFEKLDFNNRVIDGKRIATYRYFVKALKTGVQKLQVTALMRQTTDDSIKETVLGRDNDQDLVFIDTKITTKPQRLNIIAVPNNVKIIGSFTIESSLSKNSLEAFEPLQLKIKVSGRGDFNQLKPFSFSLKNGKIFKQKAEKHYVLSEKGYEGYLIWRYAMTSAEDFTLKSQKINFFDTASKTLKTLEFKATQIKVQAKKSIEHLLDSQAFPPKERAFNWQKLINNSLYFFGGIIFVFLLIRIKKAVKKMKRPVKRWTSVNELLNHLITSQENEELLIEIEKDMKKKRLKSLSFYLKKLSKKRA